MHVIGKNFLLDKITKRDFTKNDKKREHLTGKKISKIFKFLRHGFFVQNI